MESIVVDGVEFLIGMIIIVYILKLTGLDNVIDPTNQNEIGKIIEVGGKLFGANFVLKKLKTRDNPYKQLVGKKTPAYMEDNQKLSDELKGLQKKAFDKSFAKDIEEYMKTPEGQEYFKTDRGKNIIDGNTYVVDATPTYTPVEVHREPTLILK